MFNFKKISIYILTLMILPAGNVVSANAVQNNFSGQWCWDLNNDVCAFSIKISKIAGMYKGGYDSVSQRGNKIDDNDLAFSFKLTKKNIIKTKLKAGISGNMGWIQLKIIKNKKMEWLVLKKPEGEFYVPSKAILHRCKSM